ncbi:MAG: hypothetical protein EHM53_01580 [Methanoregulaceae archaeon]|nr:MAG: hypothetical protein EHM53_01580 [Methanoregulaceae archaeon]
MTDVIGIGVVSGPGRSSSTQPAEKRRMKVDRRISIFTGFIVQPYPSYSKKEWSCEGRLEACQSGFLSSVLSCQF